LATEPLHIAEMPVTPDFWSVLAAGRLGPMTRMISFSAFEGAWRSWEKHPASMRADRSARAVCQVLAGTST
jgi:hypothetical protein